MIFLWPKDRSWSPEAAGAKIAILIMVTKMTSRINGWLWFLVLEVNFRGTASNLCDKN